MQFLYQFFCSCDLRRICLDWRSFSTVQQHLYSTWASVICHYYFLLDATLEEAFHQQPHNERQVLVLIVGRYEHWTLVLLLRAPLWLLPRDGRSRTGLYNLFQILPIVILMFFVVISKYTFFLWSKNQSKSGILHSVIFLFWFHLIWNGSLRFVFYGFTLENLRLFFRTSPRVCLPFAHD